jgi:transcription elongation factor GreA
MYNKIGEIKMNDIVKKIPITVLGLKILESERNNLKNVERPKIIKAIGEARELGDLSENAEYHAAREQQGLVEVRLNNLDSIISMAEVIDPSTIKNDKIVFGATVTIQNIDTQANFQYQIVGEHEGNLDKGLISYTSPLAHALIGKKVGDIVDIATPNAVKSLEVLKLEYK